MSDAHPVIRPCLHCRRACTLLWCRGCVAKARARGLREARKPLTERAIYRDLDWPAHLALVRQALEAA